MSYPAGPWAPAPPYQPTPPDRPHSQSSSSASASHGPPIPPASTRPSSAYARHVPEQPYPGPGPHAYAYEQPQPQLQPQWQAQPQPQPQAGPSQWSASAGYGSHSVESAMGDFGRMNLDGRSRDDESHSRGYGQSRQVVSPRVSGSLDWRRAAQPRADDASLSRTLRIRNRVRHRLSKSKHRSSIKAPLFPLDRHRTSLPAFPVPLPLPRPLLHDPPASLR